MTGAQRRRIVSLFLFIIVAACDSGGPPASATAPGAEVRRIVTLSPHLAELVFAVGAGDRLVGVSAYTDHPAEAADLPLVGDAFAIDHERLAMLEPDMLLAWRSGTPEHVVDELRARGYRVEVVRTENLADIAAALVQLGELFGQTQSAAAAAERFTSDIARVRSRYAQAAEIRAFFQVSRRPLYTINSKHFVSELIALCGGKNIFADLNDLAPVISVEAVLERDPDVLLASSDAGEDAFADWDRWPELAANRYGNRYMLPAAEIGRATPRLVSGARAMCAALDEARGKRDMQ